MKQEIILIGGGGQCKASIDVIEAQGIFAIAGIIDLKEKIGTTVLGYPVIGCDEDFPVLSKQYKNFHITIGFIRSNENRVKAFDLLKKLNVNLPVIISPNAYVSKHAKIGEGTIIMHQVIVNADSIIGNNCIINNKALIEHDAVIEDNCHVSTGAIINGGVILRKNSFFGSGAVSKQYVEIPENSFVKANSIVK